MVQYQVGNGCNLNLYQLYIIVVLVATGGELERFEPFVDNLVLVGHVVTVVHARQLGGEGTVASACLDMGLTLFRRVDHPVFLLLTLGTADAIEERGTGLFVDSVAGVYHMAVHRGAELQLTAQVGMIDDMGAVGLHHILKDAHGLSQIIVLIDSFCSQLLVAEESRREYFRMLMGDVVQVVGFHVA